MFKGTIVGNLGADAVKQSSNGHEFISFKVADSRKFTDAAGKEHDEVVWVSCTINGDGGKLLPYLVKGAKVMCIGRMSFNVYSSPKDRCMKAGVSLFVESIELVGGSSDSFPKQLFTKDGVLVPVFKSYWVQQPKESPLTELYDTKANVYPIDAYGFIHTESEVVQQGSQQEAQQDSQSDSNEPF